MEFIILDYIITLVDASLLLYFVSRFLKNFKAGRKTIIFSLTLITLTNTMAGELFGQGNPVTALIMIGSTGIIYKLIFRDKLLNIYLFFHLHLYHS